MAAYGEACDCWCHEGRAGPPAFERTSSEAVKDINWFCRDCLAAGGRHLRMNVDVALLQLGRCGEIIAVSETTGQVIAKEDIRPDDLDDYRWYVPESARERGFIP